MLRGVTGRQIVEHPNSAGLGKVAGQRGADESGTADHEWRGGHGSGPTDLAERSATYSWACGSISAYIGNERQRAA